MGGTSYESTSHFAFDARHAGLIIDRQSLVGINRHFKITNHLDRKKSIKQSHSQQHKHATRIRINKKLYLISIIFGSSALSRSFVQSYSLFDVLPVLDSANAMLDKMQHSSAEYQQKTQ